MNCTLETAHLFGVGLSQTDDRGGREEAQDVAEGLAGQGRFALEVDLVAAEVEQFRVCLLYTSPSPRD